MKRKHYTPPNANLNFQSVKSDIPKPKYEKRKAVFDIDIVKKVVKGLYGKDN